MGKNIKRVIFGLLLVIIGWFSYFYLLNNQKIEPLDALLMVWLSILLILLFIKPEIIENITKIKTPAFEIELKQIQKNESIKIELNKTTNSVSTNSQKKSGFIEFMVEMEMSANSNTILYYDIKDKTRDVFIWNFIHYYFIHAMNLNLYVFLYDSSLIVKQDSESYIGAISISDYLFSMKKQLPFLNNIWNYVFKSRKKNFDRNIPNEETLDNLHDKLLSEFEKFYPLDNYGNLSLLNKNALITIFGDKLNNIVINKKDYEKNNSQALLKISEAVNKNHKFIFIDDNLFLISDFLEVNIK